MTRHLSDLPVMTAHRPSTTLPVRLLLLSIFVLLGACTTTPPAPVAGGASGSVVAPGAASSPQPYLGGYGPTDPPRMSANPNSEINNQIGRAHV